MHTESAVHSTYQCSRLFQMEKKCLPLSPGRPFCPLAPGNPGLPGGPCSPCGPGGPGRPASPGGPCTVRTETD